MCGAGKSVVSDFLVEKGYKFLRFGQITLDELKKRTNIPVFGVIEPGILALKSQKFSKKKMLLDLDNLLKKI